MIYLIRKGENAVNIRTWKYINKLELAVENLYHIVEIDRAIAMLRNVRRNGGVVWVFGNGGSAANALHITNDLMKIGKINARCLPAEFAYLTAVANDINYKAIFDFPLRKFGKEADIAFGISCSGMSDNVYLALHAGKVTKGMNTILLTQNEGGNCAKVADCVISVEAPDIRIAEDIHLAIGHMIAGELGGL